jgi:hypothetical protein
MTADQLFAETGDAYLVLIHLESDVDEAVSRISLATATCPSELVDQLLRDGPSWRERLLGLVMASLQGISEHYDTALDAFHRTGGMSIVPISAALSVAIRDYGCNYTPEMTGSLDRNAWDGEIGFALDCLHHAIGIAAAPDRMLGPNYGQDFAKHLDFYTTLCQA